METISDSSGIRGSVESFIGGREENQDSYGMAETRAGMLVVVCDGMGGGPAGKTASSIATQAIIDYVSGADPDKSAVSVLEDAAVSANESVLAAVAQNPALRGMGTTCVCVLIRKNRAFIMHVGDSRCYQLRGNAAVFRTADHSYVGELVRRGSMTEEDARNSRYSNVITRAIGAGPNIEPEVDTVNIKPGDRFALMSDGIWGSMAEPQLVGMLAYDAEPTRLVPDIAARVDAIGVENGGGHDNLTLAIVDTPGQKPILNDRFSAAASKSPNDKAAGKTQVSKSDSDYKLEEISEKKPTKKKGLGVTVWLLGAALVAAVCVIVWLLVIKGQDAPEKPDLNVDEAKKASQEYIEKIRNTSQTIEETDNSAVSDDAVKKTQTVAKADNSAVYVDIITSLKDLKAYKLKGFKSSQRDELESKRGKMYDNIVASVEKLQLAEKDPNRAESLGDLLDKMKKSKKKIITVDSKNGFTRKDGEEAIDKFVGKLNNM